jgi:fumarate hydratase class II
LTTKSPLEGVLESKEVQATFADVTNYMHRINDIMVSQGKDVDGFFEVDTTQVLMALNYEPNRAIKTYKSINHVALMLEMIASSVYALAASQQAVPTGFQTLPQFGEELKKAVLTFTAASKEHHDVAYSLNVQATCDLVITLDMTKSICALSS